MTRFWPTPAEEQFLEFIFPLPTLKARYLVSGVLFLTGLALVMLAPLWGMGVGLVVILLGHLPLWVRGLTTAPGGATPEHEEVWAPVEDEWLEKVTDLETKGKEWDASPWDLTSGRGCMMLLGVGLFLLGTTFAIGTMLGGDPAVRLLLAGVALVAPQWLNGMRTTWNPSELRLKGEALEVARKVASQGREGLDIVPLLALREGPRDRYPVDARLMVRPTSEDDSGFLGVQIQVALNNVQGTDYPYLYCVVLGQGEFELPPAQRRHLGRKGGVEMVYERGSGEGVRYLVIRQHADNSGGWETEPVHIRWIVEEALAVGREAWEANRRRAGQ